MGVLRERAQRLLRPPPIATSTAHPAGPAGPAAPTAPAPPSSPPPSWPPLPATANELRIAGRHVAFSLNTNVDCIEPFRCVGVGDGQMNCTGNIIATDFQSANGPSLLSLHRELADVRHFVGMRPPGAPPTPPPPPPPSPPSPPPRQPRLTGLAAVGSATDGGGGFDELDGAHGVATFAVNTSTFAIVASVNDYGVQLIDVSDPSAPVAVGSATDGVGGFDELDAEDQLRSHQAHAVAGAGVGPRFASASSGARADWPSGQMGGPCSFGTARCRASRSCSRSRRGRRRRTRFAARCR